MGKPWKTMNPMSQLKNKNKSHQNPIKTTLDPINTPLKHLNTIKTTSNPIEIPLKPHSTSIQGSLGQVSRLRGTWSLPPASLRNPRIP